MGSLEEKKDEVLDRLVVFVGLGPLSEVFNDAVVGGDLQVFLGGHVAHGAGIPQSLGLHDPLHVGSPSVLGSDNAAGGADQSAGDNNLLVQDVLHLLAQGLKLLLVSLPLLLFLLILW